jgi:hypothetical protein
VSHTARHSERVESSRSDDARTETVYESDGADGYTPGTYGYTVSVGGWATPVLTSVGGGFASHADAAAAARRAGRA